MTYFAAADPGRNLFRSAYFSVIRMIVFLLAALLSTACAGPSMVSGKETNTGDNRRNANPSSAVNRGGPAAVVKLDPPRVNLADGHRLGSRDAVIGVIEFSDYQCPYCRDFHERIFPKLKEAYVDTGVIQFVHKDLPLVKLHEQALAAAVAANCAGRQNRFWEMHDALYANNGRLGPDLYSDLARELHIDDKQFSNCRRDPVREREIAWNVEEAQRLGITATPSFVIGKIEHGALTAARMARGAPAFEAFAQEIETLRHQVSSSATPATK